MYEQFFQLTKTPFRFNSEPQLFFFGESHKNAMSCLRTAMHNNRAVITLFGLPGTGKTTLVQKAINELIASDTLVYRISRATSSDVKTSIISEICDRLEFDVTQDKHQSVDGLFRLMQEAAKNVLLIIDESQMLSSGELDFIHEIASIDDGFDSAIKLILSLLTLRRIQVGPILLLVIAN